MLKILPSSEAVYHSTGTGRICKDTREQISNVRQIIEKAKKIAKPSYISAS